MVYDVDMTSSCKLGKFGSFTGFSTSKYEIDFFCSFGFACLSPFDIRSTKLNHHTSPYPTQPGGLLGIINGFCVFGFDFLSALTMNLVAQPPPPSPATNTLSQCIVSRKRLIHVAILNASTAVGNGGVVVW